MNKRRSRNTTKKIQRSNKKRTLHKKTKVRKQRGRILQRGGAGDINDLIKLIDKLNDTRRILNDDGTPQHDVQMDIIGEIRRFIQGLTKDERNKIKTESLADNGHSALYAACRLKIPERTLVADLLHLEFQIIQNGPPTYSYPQHGAVQAAKDILDDASIKPENKFKRLEEILQVLILLREKNPEATVMTQKNYYGYSAGGIFKLKESKYGSITPSVLDMIKSLGTDGDASISGLILGFENVLNPYMEKGHSAPPLPPTPSGYGAPPPGYGAPPPPGYGAAAAAAHPHIPMVTGIAYLNYPEFYKDFKGYSNKLPVLQNTSNYRQDYNNGNSYFTYIDVPYYFSDVMQGLITKYNKTVTVQRSYMESGHFVGHYTFHIPNDDITFDFYILKKPNQVDCYVSFQVDPGNWVQDAPLTLV